MQPPPPISTLFPYTTLFRSPLGGVVGLIGGLVVLVELARIDGRPSKHALPGEDRKSTRLNSSHTVISYAVFCLKKKKFKTTKENTTMQLDTQNELSDAQTHT